MPDPFFTRTRQVVNNALSDDDEVAERTEISLWQLFVMALTSLMFVVVIIGLSFIF